MRWHDGGSNRVLLFLRLFLPSVTCLHRDIDAQVEIQGRTLQIGGSGAGAALCGAIRGRSGGGDDGSDSSGRFEEAARAYCGILTVKILPGFMSYLCFISLHSLTLIHLKSGSRIWGIRRCVQMVESARRYHNIFSCWRWEDGQRKARECVNV
jgi:hypothetical protein